MQDSEKPKNEQPQPFLLLAVPSKVRLYGLIADLTTEQARDLYKALGATIGVAEQRGPRIVLPDVARRV